MRCRDTFQRAILTSRHDILKVRARRGFVCREGTNWWTPHLKWRQHLTTDGAPLAAEDRLVYRAYPALLMYKLERREELDRPIERLAELPTLAPMVPQLPCFRGIAVQSAMVLATALVDWRRFEHPRPLRGYRSLLPREDSRGDRPRLGSIPKAGNRHGRHVLVQAAWRDRHRPQSSVDLTRQSSVDLKRQISVDLTRRQPGQPTAVITHAWTAPQRLPQRYHHLSDRTRPQMAVVAVARERLGVLWAVRRERAPANAAEADGHGTACGAAARCASTPDRGRRPGLDAAPGSPRLECASSRRIRFVPRGRVTSVIGVYQQDQPSMLPRATSSHDHLLLSLIHI